MKQVLYYHIYMTDDIGVWSSMVTNTFIKMENNDLIEKFDQINLTVIAKNVSDINLFESFISPWVKSYPKVYFHIDYKQNKYFNDVSMLQQINSENTITENVTMQKIWNDANQYEDFKFLYIHTKGITATLNQLARGNPNRFLNYQYWREYLEWGVIENHQACIDGLTYADVAGVNYYSTPEPHFSGSFFWANSSYVKTLPDPATKDWWIELQLTTKSQWLKTAEDRFRDEMWICSKLPSNRRAVIHTLPNETNLGAITLKRKDYENKQFLSWHPV
jgi:hypothetical protein